MGVVVAVTELGLAGLTVLDGWGVSVAGAGCRLTQARALTLAGQPTKGRLAVQRLSRPHAMGARGGAVCVGGVARASPARLRPIRLRAVAVARSASDSQVRPLCCMFVPGCRGNDSPPPTAAVLCRRCSWPEATSTSLVRKSNLPLVLD